MKMVRMNSRHWLVGFACAAVLAGCGAPDARFVRYETVAFKIAREQGVEFTPQQRQDIDETLQALFGTPDDPSLPVVEGAEIGKLMSLSRLKMAAGRVGSDELGSPRGLYREHCAHCHGITGDGAGPTAVFLNPYPRDYRKGQFKFKSTPIGFKPTHDDLKRILLDGIPGTAMPSFKLLPDLEVEALIDYVKYLSIRGEVERQLLMATSQIQEPEKERLISVVAADATAQQKTAQQDQVAAVKEMVSLVVGRWEGAEAAASAVAERPAMNKQELAESQRRGRDLFYGTVANCVKCHGDSALGDGTTTDYDEWVKDLFDPAKAPQLESAFVARGLLPPRTIKPRNLRLGIYRGGHRPLDLYWRIRNGIEGTPMPASTMKPEGDPNAKGLVPGDIWDLVNYVQSLPYEPINNPFYAAREAENLRERP
jgi:mono/diheme cytochrome c family protein